MIDFGGTDPAEFPDIKDIPCKIERPSIYKCREEIPTLNDKCSKCGVNPICFAEGRNDEIYEVFDKCKGCLLGF